MKLRAFTLIETLLYLALFNVIFFAVMTWAIALSQNNRDAEYKNAVEKNAILVSEHINDSFQKGLSVDSANSNFDSASSKVRILFDTGYFEYQSNGGVLTVTNETTTFALTDKFVNVTNFTVAPVIVQPNTIVGARITVTFVAEKFPTETKTIQSYYAFR
ncbi:hypothetical protein COZ14_04925 [Candidatus Dojkabacteria bacterium CG_4_10_14_3_um_filter_Dojkabacteria_WS6_41_9]|nr:MAG: hypothetical protein COZ14_04925 [Candidatus Dojkabacteria bacterium CG_4_10_14_3_um_filter_Dojkabacteria_WS6_41_9]